MLGLGYSSSWGPNDDGRTVDGPGMLLSKVKVRIGLVKVRLRLRLSKVKVRLSLLELLRAQR
jgi:hypothetical protein